MDLDDEELKATNPDSKDLEIKFLKEKIKFLEKEVKYFKNELQFYKEIYYGE